jgi:hypothetical protein
MSPSLLSTSYKGGASRPPPVHTSGHEKNCVEIKTAGLSTTSSKGNTRGERGVRGWTNVGAYKDSDAQTIEGH